MSINNRVSVIDLWLEFLCFIGATTRSYAQIKRGCGHVVFSVTGNGL